MRVLRWVEVAVGVLLILVLGLWLARFAILNRMMRSGGAWAKAEYFGQPVNQEVQKNLAAIQADRAELLKIALFRPSAGKHDAGPFLNPRLCWEGAVSSEENGPHLLELPPELTRALAAQKSWLAWRIDWAHWKLDFSWLAALSQFDVWSIDATSPAIDPHRQYRASEFPFPRLTDLSAWSKLRLLKAKEDGDVGPALSQVHQLARLLWTNDNLVSAMVAIVVLRSETDFAAAQSPPIRGPDLIPLPTLDKARRYFWAVAMGLDPRLNDEAWGQLAQEPGLCLAVNDTVTTTYAVLVRSMLADDLAAPLRRFGALVDQTAGRCRPSWIREAWRNPDYPLLFRADDDMFATAVMGDVAPPKPGRAVMRWSDLRTHPELAKTLAYLLIGIGSPNPLRWYDDPSNDIADGGQPADR
jgi:hypothetical protein